MVKFYSQQGEDFILDQVFKHKDKGFFVEVGCIDGKRFSNTLFFEQKGWKGLCIEAHTDYIKLLEINRPGSIICHCAVAESDDEEVIFYANKRGSLSTLNRAVEARWQRDYAEYFTGFDEQRVKKRTLNTIFSKNDVDHIDILSIDIEGYEVAALQGLNLQKYRPTAIVIESDSKEQEEQIDHILLPNGYRKALRIRSNLFYFASNSEIEREVRNKIFEVEILHTGNPFFQESDFLKIISIDTRKYPCATKVIKISEIPSHSNTSSDACMASQTSSSMNFFGKMLNPNSPAEVEKQETKRLEATGRKLSEQYEVGFHGDTYLLSLVSCISKFIYTFVETGANVGTTASYVGRAFPEIKVYSCEPDPTAFQTATNYTKELKNVRILNQPSPNFLYKLHRKHPDLYQKTNLYWLDAHGYGFEWPLNDEVKFLTGALKSGFILIDDFRIPERPEFKFCQYDGQVCEFEMIAPHLSDRHNYTFVYPKYSDRTSKHHPLVGVALIVFGVENFSLPPELAEKFTVTQTLPIKAPEPKQKKVNSSEHGVMVKRNRFADVKKKLQKSNPVIVDGGANRGNMTQKFLDQYAEPTIYAFEPIPHLAEELKEKYASKENVHVFQQALGAENTTVSFNILNYQNSSSILTPGKWKQKYHGEKVDIAKTVEVQQVRLDQAISVGEIDILKLDLQGYELEALKGAGDLLGRIKIIITEVEFVPLYENQPLFGDIDLFLRNAGFRLLNLYELYTHPDGQLTSGDAVYLNTRYFGA